MKYLPYIFPKKRGAPRKGTSFLYSLLFLFKLKLTATAPADTRTLPKNTSRNSTETRSHDNPFYIL